MSDWQDNATPDQLEIVLEGDRAASFVESKQFQDAYGAVQNAIFLSWKNTLPEDKELRERLYLQITGMEAIAVQLRHLANKGKTTKAKLSRRKQ